MGIKSKIKSIFSKKKTTEPVYQSSAVYQGPVPAGGVERTFRSTGKTEGGYTPVSSGIPQTTSTSPRPKSRGGGSSTSYQGPVPASASEEVFRETGETQGGMSVKPKPKETSGEKFKRIFKPAGEIKAGYEEEALQGIADRQAKFINPYSTPSPSTGFTEAPFSSASGERTFYFTPTKQQLQEASGLADFKFGELSGLERSRAYYSDFVFGGVRGLSSGGKQLGLALAGPVGLGFSNVADEITAPPRIIAKVKTGRFGTAGEFITSSAVLSGGLSGVPKVPIRTTSISGYQGNKAITLTKIEKPVSYNPITGPTKTDFAVSVSDIKIKPSMDYSINTFTSYRGQVSKVVETGKITPSTLDVPINQRFTAVIPTTKQTGLSFGKPFASTKPYSARLSSSQNVQFGEDFSIGTGRSNLLEQNKKGTKLFINPNEKILSSQYSFRFKTSAPKEDLGFTSYGSGSKRTPFSSTFQTQITPDIVSSLPLQTTQSFRPIVSNIPKSQEFNIPSKTLNVKQEQIQKPSTKIVQSSIQNLNLDKPETKVRTSSIAIQQPRVRQSDAVIPSVSQTIIQPQITKSSLRFGTPSRPNINPPINIFQGGGFRPPIGFKLPSVGMGQGLGVGRIGSTRQVRGYTPSFSALAFRTKGRRSRGLETGFSFRPLRNFSIKRKKRKK